MFILRRRTRLAAAQQQTPSPPTATPATNSNSSNGHGSIDSGSTGHEAVMAQPPYSYIAQNLREFYATPAARRGHATHPTDVTSTNTRALQAPQQAREADAGSHSYQPIQPWERNAAVPAPDTPLQPSHPHSRSLTPRSPQVRSPSHHLSSRPLHSFRASHTHRLQRTQSSFDKLWRMLDGAIDTIFEQRESSLSFESLYRAVHSICNEKKEDELMQRLFGTLKRQAAKMRAILETSSEMANSEFVRDLRREYSRFCLAALKINDIMLYMNKMILIRSNRPVVYFQALSVFEAEVVMVPNLNTTVQRALLELLHADRDGLPIERLDVKSCATMLLQLGHEGDPTIYESILGNPYLISLGDYCKHQMAEHITALSCRDYVEWGMQVLMEEHDRCLACLQEDTRVKAVEICYRELLADQLAVILDLRDGMDFILSQGIKQADTLNLLLRVFVEDVAKFVRPATSQHHQESHAYRHHFHASGNEHQHQQQPRRVSSMPLSQSLPGEGGDEMERTRSRSHPVYLHRRSSDSNSGSYNHGFDDSDSCARADGDGSDDMPVLPAADEIRDAAELLFCQRIRAFVKLKAEGLLAPFRAPTVPRANAATQSSSSPKAAIGAIQLLFDLQETLSKLLASVKLRSLALKLQSSASSGFGDVFSTCPDFPDLLATYLDHLMRVGVKELSDLRVEEVLSVAIDIFRCVEDKDVFERLYKTHFARRLLKDKCSSNDAEQIMIQKFKFECGSSFTHKMELMFRDISTAEETMAQFQSSLSQKLPVDFRVRVLTTGSWPFNAKQQPWVLPEKIRMSLESFEKFYGAKHCGRVLKWEHTLGGGEVTAKFQSGKRHIFVVSTPQMIVLSLFTKEKNHTLAFDDIVQRSGIDPPTLKRTLASLSVGKVKLLKAVAAPSTTSTLPATGDTPTSYAVNEEFRCKMVKVKVPPATSKAARHAEKKKVNEAVLEERKFAVDACVVRVMKARKSLMHHKLIAEVIEQMSRRFKAEPVLIKRRIETLIDKDYLTRDGENRALYHYVA